VARISWRRSALKAMVVRSLTTTTRKRVKEIIHRLATGEAVSLDERAQLQKYAIHIPFIASMVSKALRNRSELESDGLIEGSED